MAYSAWAARWRVPLGFALSAVYRVFAKPSFVTLVSGGAVALLGLAIRAWAAGYVEKGSKLATEGPYALTRNPLYLGSSMIGAGFALAGRSVWVAAAFAALLVLVYVPVIRREERFLREKFGTAYDDYARGVPIFFPRIARPRTSDVQFSWQRYRANREYEAALGFTVGLGLVTLKMALMLP